MKSLSGLEHLKGHQLQIYNQNTPILVNGKRLHINHINTHHLHFDKTGVYFIDPETKQKYHLLHTNSKLNIEIESTSHRITEDQIIIAGEACFTQASPIPFAYFDESGKLNSANLWNDLFKPYILGYGDTDKPDWYSHGLVPKGSAGSNMFLRGDGQWAYPSAYSGSVSDTFLSLRDTPITYEGNIGKLLITSYLEGGSLVFIEPTTDVIIEGTNLYYTDTRVDSRLNTRLTDSSISNITMTGNLTCNSVICDSDEKLKENIYSLSSYESMEKVRGLSPKEYKFIGKETKRYGVIAQEIKSTLPELVMTNNLTKNLAVNYIDMISILISSIQNVDKRLSNIENLLSS
jgi:hypothetical protein